MTSSAVAASVVADVVSSISVELYGSRPKVVEEEVGSDFKEDSMVDSDANDVLVRHSMI